MGHTSHPVRRRPEKTTLMVVESNARRGRRPAEDGLAGDGPDAFLGALLDEHQAVGRHSKQALGLPHRAAAAAEVVHQHLTDTQQYVSSGSRFRLFVIDSSALHSQTWVRRQRK